MHDKQTSSVLRTFLSARVVTIYPIAWATFLLIGATYFRGLLEFSKRSFGPHALMLAVAVLLVSGTLIFVHHIIRAREWRRLWAVPILLVVASFSFLLPIPEERLHLLKYGALAGLLLRDLRTTGNYLLATIAAILGASLVGGLDEFVQLYTPGRVADLRDIWINATGACVGVMVAAFGLPVKPPPPCATPPRA